MPARPSPPAGFARRALVERNEPLGDTWRRIYETRHSNPLGFALTLSRFSDPSGKAFGVVYLGSSVKVAFHEAILRDRADARTGAVLIPLAEIEARRSGWAQTSASSISPATVR